MYLCECMYVTVYVNGSGECLRGDLLVLAFLFIVLVSASDTEKVLLCFSYLLFSIETLFCKRTERAGSVMDRRSYSLWRSKLSPRSKSGIRN